jgi:hypothetical protein
MRILLINHIDLSITQDDVLLNYYNHGILGKSTYRCLQPYGRLLGECPEKSTVFATTLKISGSFRGFILVISTRKGYLEPGAGQCRTDGAKSPTVKSPTMERPN